jgi:hypothetical protein
MLRSKRSSLRAAAATALLSLSLAAPAFAGHDDWRDDHGRRGYRVHRHGDSCDFRGHDHRAHRAHHRGHFFACRRCGKRWRSEARFHRHLHDHHRVAYHAIPRVIVAANWGWEFPR